MQPPPDRAVVFSRSRFHTMTWVARGRRYAFLSVLHDDAAANVRFENDKFLDAAFGKHWRI